MNELCREEIAKEAAALSRLAIEAFNHHGYLAGDHCMREMVHVFGGLSIVCETFGIDNSFDKESGSHWDFNSQTITLNKAPIETMYQTACKAPYFAHYPKSVIVQYVVALYFFHEIFHVVQKVGDFRDVQTLKNVSGKRTLASFDIVADFVAARMYASILTHINSGDFEQFYQSFYLVLSISYEVGLRSFSLNSDFKVERGLSIFLARHRLLQNMRAGKCQLIDCLAIHFQLCGEDGQYIVTSLEDPIYRLLDAGNIDASIAKDLFSALRFNNVRYIETFFQDVEIAA